MIHRDIEESLNLRRVQIERRTYEYLLRVSMLASLRRAEEVG